MLIQEPDFAGAAAVAAQDLAMPEFSIAPQLCSISCAFGNKHNELSCFLLVLFHFQVKGMYQGSKIHRGTCCEHLPKPVQLGLSMELEYNKEG